MEKIAAYKILIKRLPLNTRYLARICFVACVMFGHACSTGERAVIADVAAPLDGSSKDLGPLDGNSRDQLGTDQSADKAVQKCSAPAGSWATAPEASGSDPYSIGGPYSGSISVDLAGNSHIAGEFTGTAMLGATTHTSKGKYDFFVAKLDPGGKFLWAKTVGGSGEDRVACISVDRSGNSYVTGTFEGTAKFGGSVLSAKGKQDAFVAKLDPKGKLLWAKVLGASGGGGGGIFVDGTGNSHVTGSFSGFVTKLDSSGKLLWSAPGSGSAKFGRGIFVDGAGASYVTGTFSSATSFGSIPLTAKGVDDTFVTRIDSGGKFLWATSAGGASKGGGRAYGNGITVDSAANSYVTGNFAGTATTFGSTTLSSPPYCPKAGCAPTYKLFVAKLDHSGKFLWAASASHGVNYGAAIAVDKSGSSYVTGAFSYMGGTFGSITITGKGHSNIFVARLDTTGKWLWAKAAGGAGYNTGRGIARDCAGNSYVTGDFGGTGTFGSTTLTPKKGYGVFVWKLGAHP